MFTNYERIKRWRQRTKEKLIEAFGGACGVCGYNKCSRALNLHHINPAEKEFNFQGKCRSWNKIVEEARKCVLLCSNCHDEVHDGVLELPDNIKRFNEIYTDVNFEDESEPCPVCGGPKSIKSITCSRDCASKHRYKVDWNKIDIVSMVESLGSYTRVAMKLGVSDHVVRKRYLNCLEN